MVQGAQVADLLHFIDRLEALVAEGRRVPIGGGVVVDRRRLLELVDQMRVSVPAAVREAQELLQQREQVLAAADSEARETVTRAGEEAERLIAEHAITRAAEERAQQVRDEAGRQGEEMLQDASRRASERLEEVRATARAQMAEADRYALDILQRLETQLTTFAASVRDAIDTISRSPAVELASPASLRETGAEETEGGDE